MMTSRQRQYRTDKIEQQQLMGRKQGRAVICNFGFWIDDNFCAVIMMLHTLTHEVALFYFFYTARIPYAYLRHGDSKNTQNTDKS